MNQAGNPKDSMDQSRIPRTRALASAFLEHRVIRFLIIGGISFGIDFGLLIFLHEAAGIALWIATPMAFLTSLVFNFLLQRRFAFQATNTVPVSAVKYGLLVVFNVLATDIIVLLFAQTELTYAAGKVVSTAATMAWNFFIYKYWIFPSIKTVTGDAPRPATESDARA